MCVQNLKFVALPVHEIIGCTPNIWAVLGSAHVPFSPKFKWAGTFTGSIRTCLCVLSSALLSSDFGAYVTLATFSVFSDLSSLSYSAAFMLLTKLTDLVYSHPCRHATCDPC